MERPKVGIVISTTREGRFGDKPAWWMLEMAFYRDDLDFEIVDLRDYPLPFLGEAQSPIQDGTGQPDTVCRWTRKMAELHSYIFVTAEYNHSIPGVLKNALDHLGSEVQKKPAAFVGYGGVGGARVVEQLRLVLVELQMAPTKTAVHIGMGPYRGVSQEGHDLSDYGFLNKRAAALLDELAWWTSALSAKRFEEVEVEDRRDSKKLLWEAPSTWTASPKI